MFVMAIAKEHLTVMKNLKLAEIYPIYKVYKSPIKN